MLNKQEKLIKRRQYKFLPFLAVWLVDLYRNGDIKKAKRIAKIILKYNLELNYSYLNSDYNDNKNSSVITPDYKKVLCW